MNISSSKPSHIHLVCLHSCGELFLLHFAERNLFFSSSRDCLETCCAAISSPTELLVLFQQAMSGSRSSSPNHNLLLLVAHRLIVVNLHVAMTNRFASVSETKLGSIFRESQDRESFHKLFIITIEICKTIFFHFTPTLSFFYVEEKS